jgi:hypothetical protein
MGTREEEGEGGKRKRKKDICAILLKKLVLA